ncbi:MAG: VCBS repeat-containing protein [Acidobacteriales bacterium]|nr:VCBS repeat-containing protein [Terriglobales bacterium]
MRNPVSLLTLVLTLTAGLAAQSPVPVLYQPLRPVTVAPGGRAFTLTVHGTGLAAGATAFWNNRPLTTRVVSSSKLQAKVPASLIATATTGIVTVANAGSKVVSNPVLLPVTTPETAIHFNVASIGGVDLPQQVVTADFNRDGKMDFASTIAPGFRATTADAVVVGLSNGDGSFTQTTVPTGQCPIGIVAGDFNADGRQDMAVVLDGSAEVEIFVQTTAGGFRMASTAATGTTPGSVATGDFNRDGALDLAVTNNLANSVSILLGSNDGSFLPGQTLAPGSQPGPILVADLNRDNILDLVVGSGQNKISILPGNGDGTFGAAVNYSVGSFLRSFAVADLNGDGLLDLVASDGFANAEYVLLGNADGSLQNGVAYATGKDPLQVVIADLDGDGRLDLATANLFAGISILRGNGDGSFQAHTEHASTLSAVAVAAGDFDLDGKLDLVAPSVSNSIDVLTQ